MRLLDQYNFFDTSCDIELFDAMRCIDHVFLMNEQQQKTKGEEKKRDTHMIYSPRTLLIRITC